ncbi:MAG: OmpA family protein [Ignavibacterium album]|jgi:outer membrane protein OmpA-like peptidoglycan-associated protein|uniref:OmpA family protein n=1 Tax=Ignavibacterium album TaxID=591197 RepID=UPI0026ED1D93|nr:OmpA family protein [Ignavibacterium album]MBI5662340.1 OmpA family protein [Ignavibacterium album]
MKKLTYFLILAVLITFSQQNFAQLKDYGQKFGVRGSILFPENEFANLGFSGNDNFSFDWYKGSWLGEAFFGFELTRALELSINGGYGKYSGKAYFDDANTTFGEYETKLVPIHLRLRISPFDLNGWNPYLYLGAGVVSYTVSKKPTISGAKATEDEGLVAFVPAGIGAEFALTDRVLMDFAIGGAMTSTYDLDSYRSGSDDIWDSYFNASLGFSFVGENCDVDKDNDGLGKCLEQQIGTDPMNPDTDADGLSDGDEYLNYKTNPLNKDTDGDSLSDYDEVSVYKTNPLVTDTDGDGLNDGDEVMKYKTDPLKADSDNDGLNDNEEVMKYKTNPLKADTDGDGLKDGDEVMKYKTDPLNVDTDGDGLSDGDEVLKYKTNAINKDTDGGSVEDGVEVKRGTDPLNAEDDVVKVGVPIILEGITFDVNKSNIKPESEETLMKALKTLQTYPEIEVEIGGHTDSDGSAKSNLKLSQARADAVKAWLVEKGIDPKRITTKGYGEDKPVADNKTKEGKAKNRRIEFTRIK